MINEEDVIFLIEKDTWMMDVLKYAKSLNLPDWWICAGFVRSKIWDTVHGFKEKTSLPDVDVIYFDASEICEAKDKKLEEKLDSLAPSIPWSVKNQARMHLINKVPPYTSAVDAMSKFPETATSLGIKLDGNDNLVLAAPHGIEDAVNLEIKPTPYFTVKKDRMAMYEKRIKNKDWISKWPKVKINHRK